MNIKNYTSGVDAMRSISKIEEMLITFGAVNISKTAAGGRVTEIMFFIQDEKKRSFCVKLPARVEVIEKVFQDQVKRARAGTRDKMREQAERTAWRFMAEWVQMNLNLIELGQAETLEVFMPYLYNPASKQTLYQIQSESGFKALTHNA